MLGYTQVEPELMLFKQPSEVQCREVENKGNCLYMLVCHVECIVKVNEEGVAVPAQAFLDVGI